MAPKYILSKNESDRINVLKVLMCIAVLFIHSYSSAFDSIPGVLAQAISDTTNLISNILCDCAVPIFILISSVLLYSKPFKWKKMIRKKIRSLLVPYFIFNTLWIIVGIGKNSLAGGVDPSTDFLHFNFLQWIDAYCGILPSSDYKPAFTILWYIRDLFLLDVLAVVIKNLIDKFPKASFVLITLIWISCVKSFIIHTYALVFFVMGYYIVKYDLHMKILDKARTALITIPYFLLALMDFLRGENFEIIHRFFIIISIIFFVWMSRYMVPMNHLIKIAVPTTFFVYLTHRFIYMGLNLFFQTTLYVYAFTYLLKPFVALTFGIVGFYLLRLFAPGLLNVLIGGRDSKDKFITNKG